MAGADWQVDDEERKFLLKQIIDTLVAAGYFRARIDGLSTFDKLVGGMCWGITASGIDVDVDIIFEENATIGQRIALSDQLIRALNQMNCPSRLHPQQIQGLDLPALHPVVQFLVRCVIDHRQDTGDLVRRFSEHQFGEDFLREGKTDDGFGGFHDELRSSFRAVRQFRKRQNVHYTPDAHVDATLLEYGEKFYRPVFDQLEDEKSSKPARSKRSSQMSAALSKLQGSSMFQEEQSQQDQKQSDADERKRKAEEARKEEETRMNSLQEGLDQHSSASMGKISGSLVSDMIGLSSEQIREHNQQYQDQQKQKQQLDTPQARKQRAEEFHQKKIESLFEQMNQLASRHEEISTKHANLSQQCAELNEQFSEKQDHLDRVVSETSKLDALEQEAGNQGLLKKLRKLIAMNEVIKRKEQEFKKSCKQQLGELKQAIAKLKEQFESSSDAQKLAQIEEMYRKDCAKMDKIRQVLAERNQQISKVRRDIDEVPTRAELLQYERRFVELYELVAAKLKETRKYYALHNTLDTTHDFSSKEISLLKDLQTGYQQNMSSTKGRQAFTAQFKNILDSVEKSLGKVQADRDQERTVWDTVNKKFNRLMDKQRKYFQAVKLFEEECTKNERLQQLVVEQGTISD